MPIPKFHDEKLGRLPERFFLALGHLQYAYTILEVNLAHQIKFVVTGGYDPGDHPFLFDRIASVLGGMRMDVAKDTLKRLLRVTGAPTELIEYVNLIFAQLSEIQYFRNRLTHYSSGRWFWSRGSFRNTDLGLAREHQKSVTVQFDYAALEAARHDLHAITYYLEQVLPIEGEAPILEPPSWQYKPSMLVREGRLFPHNGE